MKNSVTFAAWAKHREKLLPAIQATEQRNNHKFADQIDNALLNERAFLFLARDGFMVLQPVPEPGGVISVNIMFAYNDGGDACVRYQSIIEQLTREIGGRIVHFYTKVAELKPVAEKVGYALESVQNGIHKYKKTL